MSKLKVMTIVGTRPEIIRLSRVVAKLDQFCEHTFVHTGQNYDYELNGIFFEELEVRKPDVFLEVAGKNAAETISQVILASDRVLSEFKPDALLVLGDTNSTLSAIAAKRRRIPIFHMEAGNRCFDDRVPEEINRRIVDHISDINMPYSDIAREYLMREGLPPDQIIKTGSPMREVLEFYSDNIFASNILERLNIVSRQYFLVSFHREENVDSNENFNRLIRTLNNVADKYNLPIIVSTHPRTRNRLDELEIIPNSNIKFLAPFGFYDYIKLQIEAKVVLSDSGTITEESSILNFPALNLRESHERPEGFEEASVMLVGLNSERVLQGIDILYTQPRGGERALQLVKDYSPKNISDKVLRIIQSYTDVIRRKTWKIQV